MNIFQTNTKNSNKNIKRNYTPSPFAYFFYVNECFASTYICALGQLLLTESRKEHYKPYNWNLDGVSHIVGARYQNSILKK